MIVYLL